MNVRSIILAAAVTPLLWACGGASDSPPPPTVRLCPASIDYGTSYIGGGADGELIKLQVDTTKMTWQITYLASAVPLQKGTVQPTRAGTTDSGTLSQETLLPTEKLNQCAFRLNGASLDPSKPARIFVGDGVIGGTIPGKELQFSGVLGVGAIPDTTFPYFPFISFSNLETNLANIAGSYNQLGFHQVPSQNFASVPVQATWTINKDGTYSECDATGVNAGKCQQGGTPFTPSPDGSGAFATYNYPGLAKPTLSATPRGTGYLIVGKLRNQLVPILIRVGSASSSPTDPYADDEIGISQLARPTMLALGSQNGEYIGVDSTFNYRTTALVDKQATILDPFNASQAALATALDIDYTQKTPGVITSTHTGSANANTGQWIFGGGVFAYLDQVPNQTPYFMIGAFVQ